MAISRYTDIEVVKDSKTGVRNYSTIIFSNPPLSAGDVYMISRTGDRLDLLAYRFYGDSTLWWVIGAANNLMNSFYIPPGTRLRVPSDVGSVIDYIRNINQSR